MLRKTRLKFMRSCRTCVARISRELYLPHHSEFRSITLRVYSLWILLLINAKKIRKFWLCKWIFHLKFINPAHHNSIWRMRNLRELWSSASMTMLNHNGWNAELGWMATECDWMAQCSADVYYVGLRCWYCDRFVVLTIVANSCGSYIGVYRRTHYNCKT